MIFATVGTQLPFDRLITTLDGWCQHRNIPVFAQTGPSLQPPRHMAWSSMLAPREFSQRLDQASLVVAHAGMGTILSALCLGKRIVVMPRRASLGEHRNEHQLATARRLAERGLVDVAHTPQELVDFLNTETLKELPTIQPFASNQLCTFIRGFIEGGN